MSPGLRGEAVRARDVHVPVGYRGRRPLRRAGSSWLRSSSSEADTWRNAPSESRTIVAAHATASWDTACR
jgi:hypothetical protein